ncbi:MAG: hypothetical protein ABSH56_30105 [Bryobacteraceae bacterium]
MSFTVVPLHNLNLPSGTTIPFGKFTIQDVPGVLLSDGILEALSAHDRASVQRATRALVSDDSFGHPDPEWQGTQPKGIQQLRWESALLANMSIWVVMPSPACLSVGFHALTFLAGSALDRPIFNGIEHETTLFCHERDFHNVVTDSDLRKASRLFETLSTVPRKNAVWPALRAFWAALTSYHGDLRYPLFWQGLESLFGSDQETYRVSKRLRDRISYFLAANPKDHQDIHDKVKACYAVRSDIVHGRWEDSHEFHDVHMYTTEAIVRTVVRQIADRPGMLASFLSPKRNAFLETWVQSGAFTPPFP